LKCAKCAKACMSLSWELNWNCPSSKKEKSFCIRKTFYICTTFWKAIPNRFRERSILLVRFGPFRDPVRMSFSLWTCLSCNKNGITLNTNTLFKLRVSFVTDWLIWTESKWNVRRLSHASNLIIKSLESTPTLPLVYFNAPLVLDENNKMHVKGAKYQKSFHMSFKATFDLESMNGFWVILSCLKCCWQWSEPSFNSAFF